MTQPSSVRDSKIFVYSVSWSSHNLVSMETNVVTRSSDVYDVTTGLQADITHTMQNISLTTL